MTLRTLHRTSAIFITVYASLHIANHLASLDGVSAHIAFMDAARKLYRQPIVELLLLSCVAFQVGSGLWFVVHGWKSRQGAVAWLQAISGSVIALFLLIHVSAVIFGRTVLNLDTNFYYAAAGFHVAPYQYFFAPYYFIAVLALFAHLGCATYWQLETASPKLRTAVLSLAVLAGGTVALLIVLSLAGKLHPVDIPATYRATYAAAGLDNRPAHQKNHSATISGACVSRQA